MKKLMNNKGYTLVEILIVVAILGIVVMPFFRVILDATYVGNASSKKVDLSNAAQDVFERIKSDNMPLSEEVKLLADGLSRIEEISNNTIYDDLSVKVKYTNRSSLIGIENKGDLEDGDISDVKNPFVITVGKSNSEGISIKYNDVKIIDVPHAATDDSYTIKLDENITVPQEYEVTILYGPEEIGDVKLAERIVGLSDPEVYFQVVLQDDSTNTSTLKFLNMTGGSHGRFVKVYEYNDDEDQVDLEVTNQDITGSASTSSVFIYSGLSSKSKTKTEIKWYDVEVIFEENSTASNSINGKIIERFVTTIHKDVSN